MDETENEIVEDVRETLAEAMSDDDERAFGVVVVTDDQESFLRLTDPAGKIAAGIVRMPSERRAGSDNSEQWIARMPLEVVLKATAKADSPTEQAGVLARLNSVA